MSARPERVIDFDGHVVEPMDIWDRYLPDSLADERPRYVQDNRDTFRMMLEGKLYPYPSGPNCGNPDSFDLTMKSDDTAGARVAAMDEEGIDIGLLYPSYGLLAASATDPGLAVAMAQAYNNWLADFCAEAPGRFVGVGLLPVQDVDAAASEAQRCVGDLGFAALLMHPNPVDGVRLDDPRFDALYHTIEDLGVPLTFHEGTGLRPAAGADRFDQFFFTHAISHPFELMLACAAVVAGGVLARHPKLSVGFLESGASWLPFWLGRLDEHWEKRGHETPWLTAPPSQYFFEQCFISCDPDEPALHYAADYAEDHIVFASDFPHWDAIYPGAVQEVEDNDRLTDDQKRKILGDNAARILADKMPAIEAALS